ncbi:Stealth CR1 domain-containing protein [Companilactobacillus kimchii]|uniref:Stealth CR1 domain-containing protein n=1 Tax=Companilactobacillus kimchii TaxID=2801452 RepID=UPI000AEC7BD9|nr:Stealth CR1 domain-containing protein [Companilactobacillus kimchii]
MLDEDIDVVIPWVDNTDPIWRDKAKQYIDLTDLDGERFRDYDTIKYAIRSVEYNMPWVHQIFW